jgi:hypothetical protein
MRPTRLSILLILLLMCVPSVIWGQRSLNPSLAGTWKKVSGDTSNCGCDYLRISTTGNGKCHLLTGFDDNGSVSWTELNIRGSNGILLSGTSSRLTGSFVSSNFYATHSLEFRYRITCTLLKDGSLSFLVQSELSRNSGIFQRLAEKK